MSITLELSPQLEARLRAEAEARGVAPETLALETISRRYEVPLSAEERREIFKSLRGRVKGAHPTVDEFLAERSAEGRQEAKR